MSRRRCDDAIRAAGARGWSSPTASGRCSTASPRASRASPSFWIFLHVLEKLWKVAHVLYREGSPEAQVFVYERAKRLLEGHVDQVVKGLAGRLKVATP
jgi:hypothetical protein